MKTTWGYLWRRWLVSWACCLHGLCGILTLGFWQTNLELAADQWFLDWCDEADGLNPEKEKGPVER